ncbi:MAG: PD-(D/E)XK nuclease family protein [Candidatus Bipolaricaulota bacterium]
MLVERLEQHFQREESVRTRDYFYVSEVSKCPRQIYYTMKGFPRPPLDGVTARKLAVGDDAHRRIAQALFSMGMVVAAEVPLPPDALFHGRADVIVSLNGKNYVIEVKTAHPYSFEQMAGGPRGDHALQLQLYLYHFGIPQGIILAENKATQELREFVVELDRPGVERVLEEFRGLRELIVEQGRLPELPDKTDWEFNQCRYCPYVDPCREDVAAPASQGAARPSRVAQAAQEGEAAAADGLFEELT